MSTGVVHRFHTPIHRGEQAGRTKNHQRVDQQRQHGQLHFPGFHFFAEVFRSPSNHQPGQKDTHDEINHEIDQSHADSAPDAVEPHAGQRRQPRQRIQAVVHGIDGTVRSVGGQRRPGGSGAGAKPQFLPLQIPQRIIHRQVGDERRCDGATTPFDTGICNLERPFRL